MRVALLAAALCLLLAAPAVAASHTHAEVHVAGRDLTYDDPNGPFACHFYSQSGPGVVAYEVGSLSGGHCEFYVWVA